MGFHYSATEIWLILDFPNLCDKQTDFVFSAIFYSQIEDRGIDPGSGEPGQTIFSSALRHSYALFSRKTL